MNEQQAFEEALRIQAVGAGTPTLTLDDVRGRARGIRRRRASLAAAAGVGVVAAAVVPIALLVGGSTSEDTLPPVDTPTVSDTANPVTEEPLGPGWIVGGEVHAADGTSFTPEVDGEISYLLRLGADRWVLGAYPDGGDFQVLVVDGSGAVLSSYAAREYGVLGDRTGSAVVWVAKDNVRRLLVAGSDEPVEMRPLIPSGSDLRALLPGCTVESCTTIVESYGISPGEDSTLLAMRENGGVTGFDVPGLLSLDDISPDGTLATGYTVIDEQAFEFCSAVVEIRTGRQLWETCEASSLRFSPDGESVLGIDPYPDGFGHSFVDVLDARDGTLLRHYEGGTVFDERWERDGTYLVSMQTNAGENLLLRLGLGDEEPEVVERTAGVSGEPSGIRLGG
ncbi:hypothetical protein [uncultured Nocardioides sp.]|uniref:hypothetical protein n=2 Tax=uncultured Nocardioides sp. TaxID=198441 RepID=UPI0026082BE8|nr:hypothetical protein [uncultured Nocardioides sp.]